MPPEFKSIVADLGTKYPIQSYAAIFDAGDGIPGVFFSSGYYNESLTLSEYFNPEKIRFTGNGTLSGKLYFTWENPMKFILPV